MTLRLSLLLGALGGEQMYRVVDKTGNSVDVKDVYARNVLEITSHNDVLVIMVGD